MRHCLRVHAILSVVQTSHLSSMQSWCLNFISFSKLCFELPTIAHSFQHFVKRVPLSCLAITNDIPLWPLSCLTLTIKLPLQIVTFRYWLLLLEICPVFPIFWWGSLLYWFLTCLLYMWQVVPTKPFALIAREERLNCIARRWLVVCMISYFN